MTSNDIADSAIPNTTDASVVHDKRCIRVRNLTTLLHHCREESVETKTPLCTTEVSSLLAAGITFFEILLAFSLVACVDDSLRAYITATPPVNSLACAWLQSAKSA